MLTITTHTAHRLYKARRGQPPMPRGTKLYAITFAGRFNYHYIYCHQNHAEQVKETLLEGGVTDKLIDFNFKPGIDHCLHIVHLKK